MGNGLSRGAVWSRSLNFVVEFPAIGEDGLFDQNWNPVTDHTNGVIQRRVLSLFSVDDFDILSNAAIEVNDRSVNDRVLADSQRNIRFDFVGPLGVIIGGAHDNRVADFGARSDMSPQANDAVFDLNPVANVAADRNETVFDRRVARFRWRQETGVGVDRAVAVDELKRRVLIR